MKKENGDNDNVVDLNQFRKEKTALNIRVGGYYANLEMGVYLHIVGVTSPMHTKGSSGSGMSRQAAANSSLKDTTNSGGGSSIRKVTKFPK